MDRRDFLKKTVATSAGIAAVSLEEKALVAHAAEPGPSPAPAGGADIPKAKIGGIEISRLICGGNLISGYAHSRDLIYVSDLLKQYFTDEKICETFRLCEANGVNTAMLKLDAATIRILKKYWGEQGGKIQWIAQITTPDNILGEIDQALSNGAVGVFTTGQMGDELVRRGKADMLEKAVTTAQSSGAIAGISCHELAVVRKCEEMKINPDFYMKTFHHHKYWSAKITEQHDNMYDQAPDETIAVMKDVAKPWVAFKVMAAGAITPEEGFNFAVENGADFICAGMFDFQVAEDAALAQKVFVRHKDRARPWRA
jgi:hypothetical protein